MIFENKIYKFSQMRIGVLGGTFDPIHLGHIDFIEQAIREKSLDKVYLLLEKTPRHKPVFASLEDRQEMIKLAIERHPNIKIYDCRAGSYPISNCLPEIKKSYPLAKVYLLAGRDVAGHIRSWEKAGNLLNGIELVVASRNDGITSGKIRNAISNNQKPLGVDPQVYQYLITNRLY